MSILNRLCAVLVLCAAAFGQSPVTVTGTIEAPNGQVATSGYVEFDISPRNSSMSYQIPSLVMLAPTSARCGINGSGLVKNLALSGACMVWGNDVITPSNTLYKVIVAPNGTVSNTIQNVLISGTTVDMSHLKLIAPQPVVGTVINASPLVSESVIPAIDSVWTLGDPLHYYSAVYARNIIGGTGGSPTQFLFNDGGTIGGVSNETWIKGTNTHNYLAGETFNYIGTGSGSVVVPISLSNVGGNNTLWWQLQDAASQLTISMPQISAGIGGGSFVIAGENSPGGGAAYFAANNHQGTKGGIIQALVSSFSCNGVTFSNGGWLLQDITNTVRICGDATGMYAKNLFLPLETPSAPLCLNGSGKVTSTGCAAGGTVTGSGTSGLIPEWTGATSLGNSSLTDTGTGLSYGATLSQIQSLGETDIITPVPGGTGLTAHAIQLTAGTGFGGAGIGANVQVLGGRDSPLTGGSIQLNGGTATGGTAGSILLAPGTTSGSASGTVSITTANANFKLSSTTFANLGSPANGCVIYCTDCNSTCTAGSSTGRTCYRENGAWTH